jgi:hypothetical protein|tara:strand:+ start:670 stop:1119 length:450 start_codon:yes stop_codon:yes gene_type:complete
VSDVNWEELLSANPEEIERPEPVPPGTYTGVITEFKLDTSRNKGTPYVQYLIRPVSPGADVDNEAFQKFGGSEKLAAKTLQQNYYMTPDAQWRLKAFLEKLGIPFGGRSFQAIIPEAVNKQVTVHVVHRLNQTRPTDPPFAEIDDIASA